VYELEMTHFETATIGSYRTRDEWQKRVCDRLCWNWKISTTSGHPLHLQTLMRRLINLLPRETTFVTASTGIAAIAIGGM
jgi:hypothetical protein